MKKSVLSFAIILISALYANAQSPFQKGYRGMAELGAGAFIVSVGDESSALDPTVNFSTSHGFQLNPHVFLGAGVGFGYLFNEVFSDNSFADADCVAIPAFFNLKVDFINARISPYLDFKAGYARLMDVHHDARQGTSYASFGLGCRFRKTLLSAGCDAYMYEYDGSRIFITNLNAKIGYSF